MMGDRPVGKGLRNLHDFVLRVVGFRGDRGLVDPDSNGSHNSSTRGGRNGVLFVKDCTHCNNVSRGRADAFYVGKRGIFSQLAYEQDPRHHRQHRLLPYHFK